MASSIPRLLIWCRCIGVAPIIVEALLGKTEDWALEFRPTKDCSIMVKLDEKNNKIIDQPNQKSNTVAATNVDADLGNGSFNHCCVAFQSKDQAPEPLVISLSQIHKTAWFSSNNETINGSSCLSHLNISSVRVSNSITIHYFKLSLSKGLVLYARSVGPKCKHVRVKTK